MRRRYHNSRSDSPPTATSFSDTTIPTTTIKTNIASILSKKKRGEALGAESKVEPIMNVKNHIYFYGPVNRDNGLKFIILLKRVEDKILSTRASDCICDCDCSCRNCSTKYNYDKIYVHINSGGGALDATWTIIGAMLNCRIPIVTVVEGNVASAGTLISIVGGERWMYKHSYMLIHQLSDYFSGKFEELKDEMQNDELVMRQIRALYLERTKLEEDELDAALKRDLYWDAATCLKYGLIDKIK